MSKELLQINYQLHMFICGSRSLGHQNKNGSHKNSSKRSKSVSKIKTKKNPYAEGGLDKFYALVADLDEKKQRIYDEIGSEDISFIRFVYSDESDQARLIIVRANNKKKLLGLVDVKAEKNVEEKREGDVKVKSQELLQVRRNGVNYYFVLVMLVLILVFIAIYGRSFAILCTSIAWYLVPQFIVRSSSKRKVS